MDLINDDVPTVPARIDNALGELSRATLGAGMVYLAVKVLVLALLTIARAIKARA